MPAGSTCSSLLKDTRQRNTTHRSPSPLKMQKCTSLLLVSLILCATISQTFGLVLSGKEKRGWTTNSVGYLLGPHALDNHKSFNDKHGLAGKRELQPEEDVKSGNFYKTLSDDNVLRTLIEFLTYLHLKESGALDNLPSPVSSEEINQS
ncbi:galanin peptides isoform X2 [Engystomops pustulosus]|uniref:galanin peptides isoform X2 n=1 Tax=Engystomops pustulosus TaxID=76066 RepID=UPI003AFA468C